MGETPLGKSGGATTGDQPPAAGWRSLSIGTACGHPSAEVVQFTDVHLYIYYVESLRKYAGWCENDVRVRA